MAVSFKRIGLGMAAGVLALAGASVANATDFAVGATSAISPHFYLADNSGDPTDPNNTQTVSAFFLNQPGAVGVFTDTYTFHVAQAALGTGSVVVNFSNPGDLLTLTDFVISINGTTVASLASQLLANGGMAAFVPYTAAIPLSPLDEVVFTVTGNSIGQGTYTGSVSYTPIAPFTGAVPEPAVWAMMVCGFGLVGFAMRRRRTNVCVA